MIEDIKNINSSKKELKKFGLTIGIVLLLIGAALFFYNNLSYIYFIVGTIFFVGAGFLFSKVLLPFQKFWMALSIVLGFFMSRIILGILFYFVITPIGFLARMAGKDFLDRKIEKDCESYWNKREIKEYDPVDTERQF